MHLDAYVDGSATSGGGRVGAGIVLLHNNDVIKKAGLVVPDDLVGGMANVSGELYASFMACFVALELEATSITIHHDYIGIEKFATGEWVPNKVETLNYAKYMCYFRTKLDVKFQKIKAHSGDYYNEMADRLAKNACNSVV